MHTITRLADRPPAAEHTSLPVHMSIRPARTGEGTALYRIKQQLPVPEQVTATTEGFLLGNDFPDYEWYISHADVLIAEVCGNIVGFGILLPDALLRASALWEKRTKVDWHWDASFLDQGELCYLDQLAFLPRYRRWAMALGYLLLHQAFTAGAARMLASVVSQPVQNQAALPFLQAVGGHQVGRVQDSLPGFGSLVSDIYTVSSGDFYTCAPRHPAYPVLHRLLRAANRVS